MNDQPKSTFARRVRAARARKYEIRDDIVIGLGLTIQPSGVRTFFFARMVHGRRRFLPDSKTGPRSVPLGGAARAVIKALPEPRDPDAYLFPSLAGGRHAHRVVACWQAVCGDANLGKVRLHDLRHTAASHAVMSGENLPLVGKLLGHRRHETTAGYAHLADGDLVETAEKVGSLIADAMNLQVLSPPSRPRSRRRYGRWI